MIYRATGFHLVNVGNKITAYYVKQDFVYQGKTFKQGRRLPTRNWRRYKPFSKPWHELPTEFQQEWIFYERYGRAIKWRDDVNGGEVYVIKIPKYLSNISMGLRQAVAEDYIEERQELGKILYIKDLREGMPFFETPIKDGCAA